jgi:DNA-binding Lrp family transcriptional regulator
MKDGEIRLIAELMKNSRRSDRELARALAFLDLRLAEGLGNWRRKASQRAHGDTRFR